MKSAEATTNNPGDSAAALDRLEFAFDGLRTEGVKVNTFQAAPCVTLGWITTVSR